MSSPSPAPAPSPRELAASSASSAQSSRRGAIALVTLCVALLLAQFFGAETGTGGKSRGHTQLQDATHSSSYSSPALTCRPEGSGPGPLHTDPSQERVLVTGCAGFLGSHLVRELLSDEDAAGIGGVRVQHVTCVDDLSGGFLANLPDSSDPRFSGRFAFVQGDLKNSSFVSTLFRNHGPFHHIFHLAAYAAEGLSHFVRKFNYANNLLSGIDLINHAVLTGTKTFVFTSSIAVYGSAQTPMLESTTPIPEDPYGIAKYSMELDLKAAAEMFPGLDFIVFRPHNVYGPRQNLQDRYRNVLGIFIRQLLLGEPLTIFGDGRQTRMFSYVDDVVPWIARAPWVKQARNQVFNLGNDQPNTLIELAKEVYDAFNTPVEKREIIHLPARLEVVHAQSDHGKSRCVFGLNRTQTSLSGGISRTVDWVRSLPRESISRPPFEFSEVEVLTNMPGSWVTDGMRQKQEKKMEGYPTLT